MFEWFLILNSLVHNLLLRLFTGIIFIKEYPQMWCKMRARFSIIIYIYISFSGFIYQKRSLTLRGSLYISLSNRGQIENNNYDIYQTL